MTPMKRMYATFPTRFEDDVLKALGRVGAVQLVSDYTISGFRRVENVDACERYIKLHQRIESILSTLPAKEAERKGFFEKLRESFLKPSLTYPPMIKESKEIEDYVSGLESRLDKEMSLMESLKTDIERLRSLERKLRILQKHNLRIDQLGEFRHIFVKAGLLQRELIPRLRRYAEGTSVTFTFTPETGREDFVVLTGLNEDKAHIENALTLLNFSEFTYPRDVKPDPREALAELSVEIEEKMVGVREVEARLWALGEEFRDRSKLYEPIIAGTLRLEEARSSLSRTRTMSLIHGWVPAGKVEEVRVAIQEAAGGAAFMRFEDASPNDRPPVKMENKGVLSFFELLTKLRGTPDYREIDPTPITSMLFPAMFGLMFGDVGNGAVLAVIGLILLNLQREFLKIPARAVRRLGGILLVCGLASIIFGILYGEVFLLEGIIHPILLSPFHNQTSIIVATLLFGVLQIAVGLVLRIINTIRRGEFYKTILSIIGLAYYIVGVLLAVKYASNMSFTIFIENLPLTVAAMGLLALIMFFPLIEGAAEGHIKPVEQLMKGFAEFIETFISFLTNSISYVRLAAFAIAHGALGLSASILALTVGVPLSYLIMNFLVIVIEGLAILIQSMRLTYYEFFTKFYTGGGVPYRPYTLPPPLT
ncbi:MAG: V-type ATP synthase subunit I [Candidatus Bathyarchaeia archaeon]